MPPTQTLYTEGFENCERCDKPLHGKGSPLPAKGGRRRYLCEPCTEFRHDLEALVSSPDGIERAERHVEMLVEMEEHPLVDSDHRSDYYQRIWEDLYRVRVGLQNLICQAGREQPWD